MIGFLIALYPARWRQRYGEEFRAVLESRPLGPFDVADVLIGAFDARLSPHRFAGAAGLEGGDTVMVRIGGLGAVIGGLLWFIGLARASQAGADGAWTVVLAVGTAGILLALVGLSAFQAHRDPVMTWAAFAIPGLGSLLSIVGLIGMAIGGTEDYLVFGTFSSWALWIVGLLATVIGSILFAIATIRAAVFSRGAAVALAFSSLLVLLLAAGSMNGAGNTSGATLVTAIGLGSFAASWVALGVLALRRGPIRATVGATA
jgi:hypothetical protein